MPTPACLTVLGLLCLTGENGPATQTPPLGLSFERRVQTRRYSVAYDHSDLYGSYDLDRMPRRCGRRDGARACIAYQATYSGCSVSFVLIEPSGPRAAWSGDRYKISSNTASSLVRAVSEVYAMSGEPNGAPLFPLTRLIDKARVAASCASGA